MLACKMAEGSSVLDCAISSSELSRIIPRQRHKSGRAKRTSNFCSNAVAANANISNASSNSNAIDSHKIASATASSTHLGSAVVLVERSEIVIDRNSSKIASKVAANNNNNNKVINSSSSNNAISANKSIPKISVPEGMVKVKDMDKINSKCSVVLQDHNPLDPKKKVRSGGNQANILVAGNSAATVVPSSTGAMGKKRCIDRYDSSESSDSGVAVSCSDNSSISNSSGSSTSSDITEPSSPCSTSSDEGVSGVREAAASPQPQLTCKLAPNSKSLPAEPQSNNDSRPPHWPWMSPLSTTPCPTYKKFKGEAETGTLSRHTKGSGTNARSLGNHANQDSQGKITEYFKTQIKPQQQKPKRAHVSEMSVLLVKSASEFRRQSVVPRDGLVEKDKGNLAKFLDSWDSQRFNGKHQEKKMKGLNGLAIPSDVLSSLPSCKISSLRLTSEASPIATSSPICNAKVPTEQVKGVKENCTSAKAVNENNNVTKEDLLNSSIKSPDHEAPRRKFLKATRKSDAKKSSSDRDEEEESSRDSNDTKSTFSSILSTPTTIRFPAKAPGKETAKKTDSGFCRWDKCETNCDSSTGLLEHLQIAHINTQTGGDNYTCQWDGCKVRGKSSCSRRWLERHVLSHGGNKPYQCIVDGCGCRFSSQIALERHVNNHFSQPEATNNNSKRNSDSGGKLVRRNGKKLRYRRQPWSARATDYFDSGVMENLQHNLNILASLTGDNKPDSIKLKSQVVAKRIDQLDGKTRVLLKWYPEDIEPERWVLESEVVPYKFVELRTALEKNFHSLDSKFYTHLFKTTSFTSLIQKHEKQRRKPLKQQS